MTNTQKVIKGFAIGLAIFIIIAIINGIVFGLHMFGALNFKKSNNIEISETYDFVKELDIDINASAIKIELGSDFSVNAENVSKDFISKLTNGKLKIKEESHWGFWNNITGKITITIPKNHNLEKISLESGAGKIEIQDLIANNIKISQGAGLLKIENSSFQNVKLEGGAGKIAIKSSILEDLKLDSGVGKVSIDGEILGLSKIESGIGEIEIKLGSEKDYSIYAEKGIGSIQVGGRNISDKTTTGSGKNKLNIEGGIGAIHIDFGE